MRRALKEWRVTINGREIRTPSRKVLGLPTEEMAWGIAAEWEAQSGVQVQPHTMPLMTLASTTIDQLPQIRPKMVSSMLRCLEADGACFRSEQPRLAAEEERLFAPLLQWCAQELRLPLASTTSLTLRHPVGTHDRARRLLGEAGDWELAALDWMTSGSKSLVLALALARGRIEAVDASIAARVAEQHQIDEWGEVEAGHDLDAAHVALSLSAGAGFCRLLRLPTTTSNRKLSKFIDIREPDKGRGATSLASKYITTIKCVKGSGARVIVTRHRVDYRCDSAHNLNGAAVEHPS